MTDALWLAFSERVCVDDQLRLSLQPRGDDASSLAQLGERNLSTLASIAVNGRRALFPPVCARRPSSPCSSRVTAATTRRECK